MTERTIPRIRAVLQRKDPKAAAAPKNLQKYNRRLWGLFYSTGCDGNGGAIKMDGDLKMQRDWPIP
jgi:hypothetical protein